MYREDAEAPVQPVIMVEGESISLGPIRRDLVPLYHRWFNDLATLRTLVDLLPMPLTFEQEERWFVEQERPVEDRAIFTIYERPSLRPIGNTGLRAVDLRNGTAEFGIAIGAVDARGRGHGTEATRLILDYAFTALGLRNVMLRVAGFNLAGRHAYERAGFHEIGRRRKCAWMAGKLWDVIYMDAIAPEFESPVLSRILVPDQPRPG